MSKHARCSNRGVLLGLLLVLPVAVHAQSQTTAIDATAPVVQHEAVADEVSAGTPLTISATVTDNVAVDSVTLFYRSRGEAEYQRLAMERLGSTDIFVATLDTDAVRQPALEYYIEAADAANNLLLVGYALSPLSVDVTGATLAATPATQATPVIAPETEARTSGWLWVLMGLGAAALLAGSSGGGGGGSGDVSINGPLPE